MSRVLYFVYTHFVMHMNIDKNEDGGGNQLNNKVCFIVISGYKKCTRCLTTSHSGYMYIIISVIN